MSARKPFWRQPSPTHATTRAYLRSAVGISLGIGLVLLLFQPFGLDLSVSPDWWAVPGGFAGVTFLLMLLSAGWRRLLPDFFREQHWTLGKEILWTSYHFILISYGNFHFGQWYFDGSAFSSSYANALLVTILVGLIPYSLGLLLLHLRRTRQHLAHALEMNTELQEALQDPSDSASLLDLPGDKGLLPPVRRDELLFVESKGNYLYLWVRKAGHPASLKVRSTLKELEATLAADPFFFRCHRAFLLNLSQVQEVEGNAAGYAVTVDPHLPPVPVSRRYGPAFREALHGLHVAP